MQAIAQQNFAKIDQQSSLSPVIKQFVVPEIVQANVVPKEELMLTEDDLETEKEDLVPEVARNRHD